MTKNFHLIDTEIKDIKVREGVVLLPSQKAWSKYQWSRKFFKVQPQLGYFLWIKESLRQALSSCISLESAEIEQKLKNLIVVEKGIKANVNAVCNAGVEGAGSRHIGNSEIVLKKGAVMKIKHQHAWQESNVVKASINFQIGEEAEIVYLYKNLCSPEKLLINSTFNLEKRAKVDSSIIIEALQTVVGIKEKMLIKGKDASGSLVLKLVGKKGADINAVSEIDARSEGRGHLDCQGLMISDEARISLTPKLVNNNKQALITHEASIGRIEKEKLQYLQSRGFSEDKAVDLLVKGFLGVVE